MNTFKEMLLWLVIGAASAPIWGSLLYVLWQGVVRPRLIPSEDIERLAAELLERHGDHAANAAFADECQAWRHSSEANGGACGGKSNGFGRGKWRRVRRQIERRRG